MIRRFLPLTLLLIAASALSAEDKVPIPLELPRPLFVGTPVPIKVPNLEKPSGVARPPFLAPVGTVNLAKGKPVTASDSYPVIGDIDFVTDGEKDGSDGTFVEFGPGLQWVQIDLGAPSTLYAIVFWHFHSQARVYHAVIVQVSDDPAFKTGVETLFNNDYDNSAKMGVGKDPSYIETAEGRLVDAKGVKARYVRLYSNGNTTNELNHYVEVEVYGSNSPPAVHPTAQAGADHKTPGRGLDVFLLLIVLGAALVLRTDELGARPMHADEANQAVKLGQLLEGGTYVFNPADHHGPTLYYLALVPAWLRGQTTLAELTESTVRLTPAMAGVAGVALLWLLVRPWGRWPALTAALLLAVSPPAVYYSRYFIQETLLVTFTLGAMAAGRRWWRSGGAAWAIATGACFGLMLATKETALVFAATALAALAVSRRPGVANNLAWREAGVATGAAVLVAALFYSSFGANPAGLRDGLLSPWTMLGRATGGASGHEKPWWYYARLFVWQRNGGYLWDQSIFLVPALVGGVLAARRRGLPRFFAIYTAVNALILSLTPYKTPWLVINLLPGLCGLAALALTRLPRVLAVTSLLGVIAGLGWQTRQAVFRLPADERNPFAYVHTSPDMKKVPALAAAAPAGPIKVISKEYWPLPWYLRRRQEVGYWNAPPENCDGALVFADSEQADAVRAHLHGKYRERFLGLRPGFVLVVFVRE